MSDDARFDLQLLSPGQARAVEGMTYPVYRHLLSQQPAPRHPEQGDQKLVQPLAIAAWFEGSPVGLALAETPADVVEGGSAELLSLYVHPALRGAGLGSSLVLRLAEVLAARGMVRLTTVYMTGRPGSEAFERVLAKCGFGPPVTRTVTLRFTPDEALSTPWFARFTLPAPEYEIFAWSELRPEEREKLRQTQAQSPWITAGLEPWAHDRAFDPLSSLGLRNQGSVVGWVINHRISEDTVRFTCSFMRKDLGRRGRILPLYTASIERLRAAGIKTCTFVTPVVHRTMVEFVKRRCAAWASFYGETRGAARPLAARPAALVGKPRKGNGPSNES